MNWVPSGGSIPNLDNSLRSDKESSFSNDDFVDIAVRVYPESTSPSRDKKQSAKGWRRPKAMLVFDTETRTDARQSLLFGCFRFVVEGRCLREALFHADDLSKDEQQELRKYVANRRHKADTVARRSSKSSTF